MHISDFVKTNRDQMKANLAIQTKKITLRIPHCVNVIIVQIGSMKLQETVLVVLS